MPRGTWDLIAVPKASRRQGTLRVSHNRHSIALHGAPWGIGDSKTRLKIEKKKKTLPRNSNKDPTCSFKEGSDSTEVPDPNGPTHAV